MTSRSLSTNTERPGGQADANPNLPPQPTSVNGLLEDHHNDDQEAEESTPLLRRPASDAEQKSSLRALRKFWWTIISIAILLVITVNIIVFAFVLPSAAQSYATQATTYSLSNVKIDNFTDGGVVAEVKVNITVDASRVNSTGIRNLGLFTTSIVKYVYTDPCNVSISLPEYDGAQVAIIELPAMTLDVRNLHTNVLDIVSDVTIVDNTLAVEMASDLISGRKKEIRTIGETDVRVRAGIIPLGKHHVTHEVVIQGNIPTLPEFIINQLNVVDRPDEGTVMTASAQVANPFPVTLDIPSLAWKVLLPGCSTTDRIRLADAYTEPLSIHAGENITVNVSSTVSTLPQTLLDPCNDEEPSPLEVLFKALLDPNQNNITFFISGAHQLSKLPKWIPDILSSLTVPIPLPHLGGNTTDLVSSIHCSEMRVTFPSPWAPPGTPAAQPKVSGVVEAVIRPPKEAADVAVNVTAVKADVYLSDKGQRFGRIVVPEWSPATTERREMIHVKARVAEVPIEVLDSLTFQRVMTKVLRGGGTVEIGVDGTVDAQVIVLVGNFTIRGIPVEGIVEVQGIYPFDDVKMELADDINVLSSSRESVTLSSSVKVNNPTEYEAFVPYLNLQVLYEGHLIGNATAINATVSKGNNTISGIVTYAPSTAEDIPYAEKFLGEYLSGHHPNITVRFHDRSIEGNPTLSSKLSGLNITIPVPFIHSNHSSPFIKSATIHILSSTAQFELFNPLSNTAVVINSLYANATYDGENLGTINEPTFNFEVLAGREGYTTTDKIPVEVGSVGYDVVRRALGGQLMVDAVADVVATIGKWRGSVRYYGQGLGANVRL